MPTSCQGPSLRTFIVPLVAVLLVACSGDSTGSNGGADGGSDVAADRAQDTATDRPLSDGDLLPDSDANEDPGADAADAPGGTDTTGPDSDRDDRGIDTALEVGEDAGDSGNGADQGADGGLGPPGGCQEPLDAGRSAPEDLDDCFPGFDICDTAFGTELLELGAGDGSLWIRFVRYPDPDVFGTAGTTHYLVSHVGIARGEDVFCAVPEDGDIAYNVTHHNFDDTLVVTAEPLDGVFTLHMQTLGYDMAFNDWVYIVPIFTDGPDQCIVLENTACTPTDDSCGGGGPDCSVWCGRRGFCPE